MVTKHQLEIRNTDNEKEQRLKLLIRTQFTLFMATFGMELLCVSLEKVWRLLWMATGDIMESRGGDVVGLAFTNQGVVLEKVLNLRLIALRLRMENLLCFRPKIILLQSENACPNS